MFQIDDHYLTRGNIEPCDICRTLIEVGPPPMVSVVLNRFDLVTPQVVCQHLKQSQAWFNQDGIRSHSGGIHASAA